MLQGGVDHVARPLGALRRRRADGRNGLNFTERGFGVRGRGRLLGPRPHRGLAAAARARSTGTQSSDGRRALVPHRRDLRGAVARPRPPSPRRRWRPPAATARSSPTTSTTGRRCGRRSAASARRAGGQPRAGAARRRDARATRRTSPPPSASRSRARTRASSALDPAGFGRMIDRVVEAYPNLAGRGHDPARASETRPATTGARPVLGGRRRAPRHRSRRTSRSSTASAAAIRSPPGLIYGLLSGDDPQRARRVRRGPRRPRDDDARRHVDGDPRRGGGADGRRRRPRGPLTGDRHAQRSRL